jgi:hypothetical protein
MNFNRNDNRNLPKRHNPLRDESSFFGESSELARLKAEANIDLEAMNGFIQGGGDDFSQNNPNQENNTITYSLYNPTTSPLSVELYGFDPANFTTVPVNPAPTIVSGPFLIPPPLSLPFTGLGSVCTPNNTLYIGEKFAGNVIVLDCATNTIIATIPVPIVGFVVLAPCYCPVNNQMYVCSGGLVNQTIRIDCNTNTIIGPPIITTAPFIGEVGAILYNPIKNSMYGTTNPNDIVEISCTSNLQVASVPSGVSLGHASFNPLYNRIYINNNLSSNLSVFDCVANIFLAPIPLPFNPGIRFDNCYCSFNNSIYIVSQALNLYCQVDTATAIVSPPLPNGLNGTGSVVYNPINNLIYMSAIVSNDYETLDVATNTFLGATPLIGAGTPVITYNQNDNSLYIMRSTSSNYQIVTPLFLPTVTINMPGGVTPAMIYNDTQDKPFLIRGVRIITDNFSQWNNNITFSNTSYTGAANSTQWQPLNYISPTNANTLIVDAPDFVLDVDRGPDSTALDFVIQPLTNVILLFTVGRSLDSSTIFGQQNKEDVDNTNAIRFTGNPIADIFLGKMTKEEITAQESKYSSTEYANYPRETGNPIADIALLRNYGIQGI